MASKKIELPKTTSATAKIIVRVRQQNLNLLAESSALSITHYTVTN